VNRFPFSGPYPLPVMKLAPVLLKLASRFLFDGEKLDVFSEALDNDIRGAVNDALKLSGMLNLEAKPEVVR
jgi:hypothetical protein